MKDWTREIIACLYRILKYYKCALKYVPRLPWTSCKGVWFRRQSTDWAEVDDIARQFRLEQFLDVSSNLHVGSSSCRPEVLHSRNLMCKSEHVSE